MYYPPGALVTISRGEVADTVLRFFTGARVPQGSLFIPKRGGPNIPALRNEGVRDAFAFVRDCAWVAFVDSDEDCRDPGAVKRLLDWERPVVSGVVCERGAPFLLPAYTALDPPVRVALADLPEEGLVPIVAVGTGFLLVWRAVFDALGDPWFRHGGEAHGVQLGHDLDFTYRAHRAGFAVALDAGLPVGHHVRATVWPGRRRDRRPWLSVDGEAEAWYPAGPPPRVAGNGRVAPVGTLAVPS